MRKRSTSGTQIVSFSCDSDLAEKFKSSVEYGERSEYLENILRTNIDSGVSYSCNSAGTSSSQPRGLNYIPMAKMSVLKFSDDDLRILKRRLNSLKE